MSSGFAAVADLGGRSRDVVARALSALIRLSHPGGGSGITIQVPDELYRAIVGFRLPQPGFYATGLVFLPDDARDAARAVAVFEKYVLVEGATVLGWRDLPADGGPTIRQVFLTADRLAGSRGGPKGERLSGIELERVAYVVRKQTERETSQRAVGVHFPSLSARTITYKGSLTPDELIELYRDLGDDRVTSAFGLVHAGSDNRPGAQTTWADAQPGRRTLHCGGVASLRANRNALGYREALMATSALPGNIKRLFPVVMPESTGPAAFDEAAELLFLAGRDLPHVLAMMMPEAWENDPAMDPPRRAFHRFHASLMEPWEGAGPVVFTDGSVVGAVTDRHGSGSARWCRTEDGLVVLASESGLLDLDPATVVARGRLRPGEMFLVDLVAGRVVSDGETRAELSAREPYDDWLHAGLIHLGDLPAREPMLLTSAPLNRRQRTFGYEQDEVDLALGAMARGAEPVGSMGADMPIAVLSPRPRLLFDYFQPAYPTETGRPVDVAAEGMVASLTSTIGPEANLLQPGPASCRQVTLPYPILDNDDLAKLLMIDEDGDLPGLSAVRVGGLYPVADGSEGLRARLTQICRHVSEAVEDGVRLLVLSDRDAGADLAPIPSLLLTAAVDMHLVREQVRTQVSLVVEAGDCRLPKHVATLISYGASAVNPYLALETVAELGGDNPRPAIRNFLRTLGDGLAQIMAGSGVATVRAYRGGRSFTADGLDRRVIQRYFAGTGARLGGAGLAEIHAEVEARHRAAYGPDAGAGRWLPPGGGWEPWRSGEPRLFDPATVFLLQHATRERQFDAYRRYTAAMDERMRATTVRGLFDLRYVRSAVPPDEVEPASEIVKRFMAGGDAISPEARDDLAITMHRLGGRSSGAEEPDALYDPRRRAEVKQVAPGVTTEYLVNTDDIEVAPDRTAAYTAKLVGPHTRIRTRLRDQALAVTAARAGADVIVLEADPGDGPAAAVARGTGHPGAPWELMLAEAQQTLLLDGLRERVTLGVAGLLTTGRDVLIAALLGAEEFEFRTAPLVVSGCVMMRVCHLQTCPVGIATQDPVLRDRYAGKPEFVENFFLFLAEEVREYLAALGFRSLDEAIGHPEVLDARPAADHWKATGLDLSPLLHVPDLPIGAARRRGTEQDHGLDRSIDNRLIELAGPALEDGDRVSAELPVRNDQHGVGAMLAGEVARRFGRAGLPDDTIMVTLRGTGGQSFGAFLPRGVTLRLIGDANDALAGSLSGGRVIVRPDESAPFVAEENVIAGDDALRGASDGSLFVRGRAGERFAAHNVGAVAVVEGVGDHGCEYMTGGTVVVIGPTGRNFAAGMSGGVAYVLDLDPGRVNTEITRYAASAAGGSEVLRQLLERHSVETGSSVAAALLAGWPAAAPRFTAVLPPGPLPVPRPAGSSRPPIDSQE